MADTATKNSSEKETMKTIDKRILANYRQFYLNKRSKVTWKIDLSFAISKKLDL